IEFFFLHAPVAIQADPEGNVTGMKVERMVLGDPDEKGRRKPVATGEMLDLECDTVISALGTKANPVVTQSTPGLALNKWGNIAADDGASDSTQATSLPGLFAGGDIVTGGATVILAMGAGRRAARAIGTYLASGKKWPITKDDVAAFSPPEPEPTSKYAGATALGPSTGAAAVRTCPKCHRPTEGDEEYICCANAHLEWHCEACHKVSEGFAFPYGLCPSCGTGRLSVVEKRGDLEGEALDAVRIAFEIELGGMAFYKRAAEETDDPTLKALFRKFAGMEEEHMATLSRRYHVAVPSPSSHFRIDRAAVYAGIDHRPDDPANLFRIAIAFEERAVKFFAEAKDRSGVAPAASELYRELCAEEREHVALLTTEFVRYRQGKPGLL
ncbi:MAG TPA: ferritin family protein, partial [Anaeromyxobacteraceae bacterium]|nr:ferritin family protein [Anaeromyxobacteraceae bacterium]